ncbi:hypothetical protein [Sandaracinus amylolyticus]|uniref:hypothetical protein n=1 Tax=Sandaracinus amylolyticus TaxID=927083 RepID=UPI0012ED247D|nr:hypothetical protein [Sandaracinus amylolyticus]
MPEHGFFDGVQAGLVEVRHGHPVEHGRSAERARDPHERRRARVDAAQIGDAGEPVLAQRQVGAQRRREALPARPRPADDVEVPRRVDVDVARGVRVGDLDHRRVLEETVEREARDHDRLRSRRADLSLAEPQATVHDAGDEHVRRAHGEAEEAVVLGRAARVVDVRRHVAPDLAALRVVAGHERITLGVSLVPEVPRRVAMAARRHEAARRVRRDVEGMTGRQPAQHLRRSVRRVEADRVRAQAHAAGVLEPQPVHDQLGAAVDAGRHDATGRRDDHVRELIARARARDAAEPPQRTIGRVADDERVLARRPIERAAHAPRARDAAHRVRVPRRVRGHVEHVRVGAPEAPRPPRHPVGPDARDERLLAEVGPQRARVVVVARDQRVSRRSDRHPIERVDPLRAVPQRPRVARCDDGLLDRRERVELGDPSAAGRDDPVPDAERRGLLVARLGEHRRGDEDAGGRLEPVHHDVGEHRRGERRLGAVVRARREELTSRVERELERRGDRAEPPRPAQAPVARERRDEARVEVRACDQRLAAEMHGAVERARQDHVARRVDRHVAHVLAARPVDARDPARREAPVEREHEPVGVTADAIDRHARAELERAALERPGHHDAERAQGHAGGLLVELGAERREVRDAARVIEQRDERVLALAADHRSSTERQRARGPRERAERPDDRDARRVHGEIVGVRRRPARARDPHERAARGEARHERVGPAAVRGSVDHDVARDATGDDEIAPDARDLDRGVEARAAERPCAGDPAAVVDAHDEHVVAAARHERARRVDAQRAAEPAGDTRSVGRDADAPDRDRIGGRGRRHRQRPRRGRARVDAPAGVGRARVARRGVDLPGVDRPRVDLARVDPLHATRVRREDAGVDALAPRVSLRARVEPGAASIRARVAGAPDVVTRDEAQDSDPDPRAHRRTLPCDRRRTFPGAALRDAERSSPRRTGVRSRHASGTSGAARRDRAPCSGRRTRRAARPRSAFP